MEHLMELTYAERVKIAQKLNNLTNVERKIIFGYPNVSDIIRNHYFCIIDSKITDYEKNKEYYMHRTS